MKRIRLFYLCLLSIALASGQTNIVSTNTAAAQVLKGNYNPGTYASSIPVTHPGVISAAINSLVSPDSLRLYLEILATFETRNSGSDTVSATRGIGASRAWIFKKFQQFSLQNQNRLLPSYLRFDQVFCGMSRHKNVFAVLPGTDTTLKDCILIEGHFDTRCIGSCDTACLAQGMEDNGSGTALVMELARVMSRYSFRRSIVFLATTGEEQGLYGGAAFVTYAQQNNIKIRAVLNNDVIGGVICGNTSSAPSCSVPGSYDSTNVRLFSSGGYNSPHKQLSRFIKLEYQEMIKPLAAVTMSIHIMNPEDRTNRGGDHIPFRQNGFTAMRFTSMNEHGNADVSNINYSDHQHTSGDILGVDTDADMQIDSFFVDFNYLSRNAVINGNAAAMAAMGPKTPDFNVGTSGNNLFVNITKETGHQSYRLALRTLTNDWDTVHLTNAGPNFTVGAADMNYICSVAAVDSNGVESLFSVERMITVDKIPGRLNATANIELCPNRPNPFDETTTIMVKVNTVVKYKDAHILVVDQAGREVHRLPVTLHPGINEVELNHGYHPSGTLVYSLVLDGKPILSRKMIFTN